MTNNVDLNGFTTESKLGSFFSLKKLNKSISFFSFWDKNCKFSNKVYLANGVRLQKTDIGDYTRIRPFCSLSYVSIGKFSTIGKFTTIGIPNHPLNRISTNLIFYQKNILKC